MPKYDKALRIDAPAFSNAADGGYVDAIDSPAPPAMATVEAPTNLTLSTLLGRSAGTPTAIVNATWSPPDGYEAATLSTTLSYLIQWSTDSTFATNVHGAPALQPSASIDGLATGTLFYFRVAAVYRTVQSPFGPGVSITTAIDTTPPDPPTSVAWNWAANGDLEINWIDPASANLKAIQVKIWNSAAKTISYRSLWAAAGERRTVYTAAMNAADTSNVYDAAVYIEVLAQSWGGIDSTVATPVTQPTKAAPATPTGLTSSWAGDTGSAGPDCVISWTKSADAVRYRLTIDGVAREVDASTYTYTLATNATEHSNTPDPVLSLSLVALDGLNQASATPATATATNAAPAAPTINMVGGMAVLMAYVTSSPALDFDAYEYVFKLATVAQFTQVTPAAQQAYTVNVDGPGSWTVTVRQRDVFGQYSSGVTSSAVILDALTIDYLRAEMVYTDDAGNSSASLNVLKDATLGSGGITYSG